MQYVTVSTITSEDRIIDRRIVGTPTSSLEPQVHTIQRMTGVLCGVGKEVSHRTWVDSRLRHKELTLCIHQVT
jgi:hypothetical protein